MLITASARQFSSTAGIVGATPSPNSVTVQTWNRSVDAVDRFLLGCRGRPGDLRFFLLLTWRGDGGADRGANTKFVSSPQFRRDAAEDNRKCTCSAN